MSQPVIIFDNWTDKNTHFSNDQPAIYYQINYVYVRENYRNQSISSLMAVKLVNNFFTIDQTANYSDHYCDNSNYASQGGSSFGNKVYSLLERNNKQIN